MAQPTKICQLDRATLGFRQPQQRVANLQTLNMFKRRPDDIYAGICDGLQRKRSRTTTDSLWTAATASQCINGKMMSHAQEPRGKATTCVIKCRSVAPGALERILGNFFGLALVAENADRK